MNIGSISGQAPPQVQPKPSEGSPAKVDENGRAQTVEPAKTASPPKDTVQVSSAAQKMLQEAIETPAQTAVEAGKGDVQAKRLVAKEAAENSEKAEGRAPPGIPEGKGSNVDVIV